MDENPIIVAIAGATGQIGQALVNILCTKPGLEIIILSRKTHQDLPTSVRLIPSVDYTSIPSLTSLLSTHAIHTVISALSDTAGDAQLNLIAAANASRPTKRFIASDWGVPFPPDAVQTLPFVAHRFQSIHALRQTDLQWTRVHNGYFMDDYGRNHVGLPFVLDMANREAAVPGTGTEVFAMTHTSDVAAFVALLLRMHTWEEATYLYGQRVTWNEVLHVAEQVRGPFTVTYDPLDALKEMRITKLAGYNAVSQERYDAAVRPMFALFGRYVVEGLFDIDEEKALNRAFPDVRTLKIDEFLRTSWE